MSALDLILQDAPDDPQYVVNPATGDVVCPPTADLVDLAETHDGLADLISRAKEAQAILSREVVARMDRRGKWTEKPDGWEIKSQSPNAGTEDYDAEGLREDLLLLVETGVLDIDAVDSAVEDYQPPTPERFLKKKKAGINALLKLTPEVVEVVSRHKVELPTPDRRASFKRTRIEAS